VKKAKKYIRVSQHVRSTESGTFIVRSHIRKNPFVGKHAIKDNKPPFMPAKNLAIGSQALKDDTFFKSKNYGLGSTAGYVAPKNIQYKEKKMDKKALDKAVEEARKKGYLEIKLQIRLDAAFRRQTFIEELSGCLDTAKQIIIAYQEKYGKAAQPKKKKKRGLKLKIA